jgi:hypothetical protein
MGSGIGEEGRGKKEEGRRKRERGATNSFQFSQMCNPKSKIECPMPDAYFPLSPSLNACWVFRINIH